MSIYFSPESKKVAFEKINSGEYLKDMFEYLKEEKFVDSDSVYNLFELDTPEEFIGSPEMKTLRLSPLAKAFKDTIEKAYEMYMYWKKKPSITVKQLSEIIDSSDLLLVRAPYVPERYLKMREVVIKFPNYFVLSINHNSSDLVINLGGGVPW